MVILQQQLHHKVLTVGQVRQTAQIFLLAAAVVLVLLELLPVALVQVMGGTELYLVFQVHLQPMLVVEVAVGTEELLD
jgi:hypothetical protein